MQKSMIFLGIVGVLIAIGIVLSFYGAQLMTQDLVAEEQSIASGQSFELQAELDTAKTSMGVYVVQTVGFTENTISATVFDPFGSQIIFTTVDRESFEDQFEISSSGTYRLLIENSGPDEVRIVGVLGHMPDTSTVSVGITGFFVLIMGLIGIVGVGIYAIRNRRKTKLS